MNVRDEVPVDHARGFLAMRKRVVFKGATYHITQRAPGREQVFIEDSDYLYFLKILKLSATEFKLNVFAFALLPNHVHILLQITEENLSSALKYIFGRYAMYFNKKYQRKGHVFCGRFWASLCEDDAYFMSVSVYIHLNPFRAGLCKKIEDYRWSSIQLYLKGPFETFIIFDKLLLMLNIDKVKARQQYLQILVNNSDKKINLLIEPKTIHRTILSEITCIKEFLNKEIQQVMGMDAIIKQASELRWGKGSANQKTKRYIVEQLRANGYNLQEIANMLEIDRTTIYRLLNVATF